MKKWPELLVSLVLFAVISFVLNRSGENVNRTEGAILYMLCYLCSCKLVKD